MVVMAGGGGYVRLERRKRSTTGWVVGVFFLFFSKMDGDWVGV